MSEDPRDTRSVQSGRPTVIAPGHTFATVTDKISSIVLTRRTPLFWFVPFLIGSLLLMVFLGAVGYLFVRGVGIWGIRVPVMWGWAHYQLRMVDWNWTRRHADLRHSALASPVLAQFH